MFPPPRLYFMTIAQVEEAVLSQITNSTADYNTLVNALQAAATALQTLYPTATLHYSVWAFQTLAGQWIEQIDIYRGEATPLVHWDVSLAVNMQDIQGTYTAVVNTLQVYTYAQPQSPVGDFTPPSVANS
jgi:hypothetical protein